MAKYIYSTFDFFMVFAPFLLLVPNGINLFALIFYVIYLPFILYKLYQYISKPKEIIRVVHQTHSEKKYVEELILV